MTANPLTPFVVEVNGTGNSSEGDKIRITVFNGETARGSMLAELDSSNQVIVDLANSDIQVVPGDTLVATHTGSALGGDSAIVDGGGAVLTISATTVAFGSRSL